MPQKSVRGHSFDCNFTLESAEAGTGLVGLPTTEQTGPPEQFYEVRPILVDSWMSRHPSKVYCVTPHYYHWSKNSGTISYADIQMEAVSVQDWHDSSSVNFSPVVSPFLEAQTFSLSALPPLC